ncbi:hypothetical protein Tco_0219281, partial [Tanacetum coccineum]
DKGKGKVDDKGKGKIDDKEKGKMDDLVDAVKKRKLKLMVSEKGTKKASVNLVDALDLQNRIKKLFEDFNISRAPTTSTRSRALIASTSNAQPAAPRGYMKIAMIGCVLGLRAPNDPNAPPPSTTRKRNL